MDDKNKLEDFLRQKLNEFDEPGDGWDKPDASVWEQAQRQILMTAKPGLVSGKSVLFGLLLLSLLLSGGYIWSLQREIGDLKIALQTQETLTKENQARLSISEKEHSEEKEALQSENEKLKLANIKVLEQNKSHDRLSLQQQGAILQLKNENLVLQNFQKNNLNAPPAHSPGQDKKTELAENMQQAEAAIFPNQNMAPLPQKQAIVAQSELPHFNIPAPVFPVKRGRNQFETGYEYALLGKKIPLQSDFNDKNTSSGNPVNKEVFIHSHGVYFAFSPKRNWFIRTGLRTAHLSLEQYQKSGIYYDKTGEYLKPDSATANDVSRSSRTLYNELESEITLAIPQDANLKTGDWLAFTIFERFRQRYFQVPLGLEYFHGKGRLQWHLHSGVQWNMVVFDDYLLKAWAESKSKGVPVDKVKVLNKEVPAKQFIGAYACIGMNYQLAGHWHARAGMTCSYDFINNKSTGFSNSQLIGSAFRPGLNYRF